MNSTLRLLSFVLLFSALVGCNNKKPATTRSAATAEVSLRDTEATTLAPLEATPDLEHCKLALTQLDASDRSVAGRSQPTPEEIQDIALKLRLTEAEANEFAQKTFSPTDAAYLEQSLMIRAAVRGLEISGKTPLEQARIVFDWVCRTVYVNDRVPQPGPPGLTLEAGQGTALARAYLMMAVWQQIGLTGCFIGPKDMRDMPPYMPAEGGKGTSAPVRLCGVKIGKELFLFNHVIGEPLFGKDRSTPVKWSELTSNPELAKEIADVSQVSQWKAFLSFPLSALSSRMAWLQGYDPGHIGVALALDYPKLLKEFQTDLGATAVDGWFPSIDQDRNAVSPLRVLNRYSSEEAKGNRLPMIRQEHKVVLVPFEFLPQTGLAGMPLGSIRAEFAMPFMNLHFGQNSATQHLIRGQFKEATTQLSDVRSMAEFARTRSEQDPMLKADFAQWSETLQNLSANVLRAGQKGGQVEEAVARQRLEEFFRTPRNLEIQKAWVLGYASRPLLAESNFLLALCVHERTLRMQTRTGTPDPTAWKTVLDWWERYLDSASQVNGPYQNRDAQAKRLKAQAEEFAAKK
ncbi:hypothetical protein [Zavarzinella formosa]|uniref:hypothetical protein n=1 Tax=Zavarzinella formosa TaxID=360055 RepID=UPI000306C066|nr:hypothetical protein [Zavarzinella formosa]